MKLVKIASSQFSDSLKNLMKMPGVPAKTMFKIRGIAKIITEESEKYNELTQKIIEEFGERDESGNLVKVSGNNIKIQKDKIKDMDEKLKELSLIEVELPTVKFEDLGEKPELNSIDLFQLEFIVE